MAKARSASEVDSALPACGCAEWGYAAPHQALGVDPELKQTNLKHLRRIEGQVRGIAGMIADDRYCTDIMIQIAAVRESLHSVARNLLRNHLNHCAAAALQGSGSQRDAMIHELLGLFSKLER